MPLRNDTVAAPHLGGRTAVVLFAFILIAFVTESQLTQYVQTTLAYRQPFFIFYVVHSSFFIIFPLHLLYLTTTTKYSASSLIKGLSIAITDHLSPLETSGLSEFPFFKFSRLVIVLTVGVTYPGLLWFAAISLASVSDVTAIWNTNAFFAYLISVKMFGLKWEPRRLVAVCLATLGVIVVVYGGNAAENSESMPEGSSMSSSARFIKPSAPLVGNVLTLIASFGYGLYQVLYKIYAALPSDPEIISDRQYEQIIDGESEHLQSNLTSANAISAEDTVYPPPFGLHPNLLTSAIGFCTFAMLWIPIPILHYTGVEIFRYPANLTTVFAISGIAFSGVVFNAGFMVLLGVWGPIITSVGNLLTIVLVVFSDVIFGSGTDSLTVWSLLGSGVIVAAFGVLAYDMFTRGS
ncbi:hypothetical protein BDQ12DRAFT_428998 [Crucibulum laeve]|uniref:EamA domain-containing protein n=1 Tax=Crucibulum laeve TaxID=68775 RepID=A0A5C3M791_9AGAR|nr:hypothetical protein BDQ12DRAFT_428998 [Crucibulum laeve]